MTTKFTIQKKIQAMFIPILLFAFTFTVSAQIGDKQFDKLETMQDTIEVKLMEVYDITGDYEDFDYEYVYDGDELKDVKVMGVDDPDHQEDISRKIYEIKKAKDEMKNYTNRVGVYYAPEMDAKPHDGFEAFREEIQNNLEYPDASEDWGVEGTVYVKFIIDSDGEIQFIKADEDIDSPFENRVEKLREEAVSAVEESEIDWEPATVDGEPVPSWMVVPIKFDFKKHPFLPGVIL